MVCTTTTCYLLILLFVLFTFYCTSCLPLLPTLWFLLVILFVIFLVIFLLVIFWVIFVFAATHIYPPDVPRSTLMVVARSVMQLPLQMLFLLVVLFYQPLMV